MNSKQVTRYTTLEMYNAIRAVREILNDLEAGVPEDAGFVRAEVERVQSRLDDLKDMVSIYQKTGGSK